MARLRSGFVAALTALALVGVACADGPEAPLGSRAPTAVAPVTPTTPSAPPTATKPSDPLLADQALVMCDEERLNLHFYDSAGAVLHTVTAPHPPHAEVGFKGAVGEYTVQARSLCLPGSIDDALSSVAATARYPDDSRVPGFLLWRANGTWAFESKMNASANTGAYDAEPLVTSMPIVTSDGTLWWLHEDAAGVTMRSSSKKAIRLQLRRDDPGTLYGMDLRLGRGGRPVVMRKELGGYRIYDDQGRLTQNRSVLDAPGALAEDVALPPSRYYEDGAAYRTKQGTIIFSTRGLESDQPKIMWRWDGRGHPERLFEFDYHYKFVRLAARPASETTTAVHAD